MESIYSNTKKRSLPKVLNTSSFEQFKKLPRPLPYPSQTPHPLSTTTPFCFYSEPNSRQHPQFLWHSQLQRQQKQNQQQITGALNGNISSTKERRKFSIRDKDTMENFHHSFMHQSKSIYRKNTKRFNQSENENVYRQYNFPQYSHKPFGKPSNYNTKYNYNKHLHSKKTYYPNKRYNNFYVQKSDDVTRTKESLEDPWIHLYGLYKNIQFT